MKTRTVTRPAPNLGGQPMTPQQEIVHDEFRFAKLDGNPQVFEIKAEKLKEIFVPIDSLRDARLARFRTEDVRKLEITRGNENIVLTKDKDHWKLEQPGPVDAETGKITELLDKLSFLQARDKDVVDKADAKSYGLDKPAARVRVNVENEAKGGRNPKKAETFTFFLGKHDPQQQKVYVRVEGVSRVNAVEDALVKLVQRPALAYRSRRVLDHARGDLARVDVEGKGGRFSITQDKGLWQLAEPVVADVDSAKVSELANDLARLEVVEYISETATPDALDRLYGLAKPSLSAKISFSDSKKPAEVLQIGKERNGKSEYFAKLASAPSIFVIKKELRDALAEDSLALRSLELWQMPEPDIVEIQIQKDSAQYRLTRKAAGTFPGHSRHPPSFQSSSR
jgi:hypothetical protein